MKKIYVYFIALFAVIGCQKSEVDLTFGQLPEERMDARLTELRSLLVSAPHGWKGSLNTSSKGGYGFYIDFKEDMSCAMLSDFSANSSATLNSSTYRVLWAMDASLVFDTFNYITMLQEPSSNFGGTSPNGFMSDIEFEYVRSTEDSLFMMGKKYRNLFVLVKATADEKEAFHTDILNNHRQQLNKYQATLLNNYISIPGVTNKVALEFSDANKLVTLQYINDDNIVESYLGKYHFEPNGVHFSLPILIHGKLFTKATLSDGDLTFYDILGAEYKVLQSSTPILPLESIYGYNKTNKSVGTAADVNILPSISGSSTFTDVWKNTVGRFTNVNVRLRHFTLKFDSRNKLTVNAFYQSASPFTATMTVDYTYVDGILTLSNPTGNTTGNWNTRRALLRELEDYILSNSPYKVDWVPNAAGIPLVGWYSVQNPAHLIYGNMMP